jgi:hypothetical protein
MTGALKKNTKEAPTVMTQCRVLAQVSATAGALLVLLYQNGAQVEHINMYRY